MAELEPDCQIKDLGGFPRAAQQPVPLGTAIRLLGRRWMGPRRVRRIKMLADRFLRWLEALRGPSIAPGAPSLEKPAVGLQPRDQVRVRGRAEIEATLNRWGQLRGCGFAPEMAAYCNTVQSVLKRVERFVDERDLQVRNTQGIVLLDGITCRGTARLGRCDRNCMYFWREEWLERVTQGPEQHHSVAHGRENDPDIAISSQD